MAGSPWPTTSAPRSRTAGCCFCSTPTSSPPVPLARAGRPALRRTPRIGALGPKLLFEDDSFSTRDFISAARPRGPRGKRHYFKGLHRDLPAANVPRPVPAVTAACLMIQRDLYRELDGLRSIYIQGDYEDSDLCLRLVRRVTRLVSARSDALSPGGQVLCNRRTPGQRALQHLASDLALG